MGAGILGRLQRRELRWYRRRLVGVTVHRILGVSKWRCPVRRIDHSASRSRRAGSR
jgi:hypothetical protein